MGIQVQLNDEGCLLPMPKNFELLRGDVVKYVKTLLNNPALEKEFNYAPHDSEDIEGWTKD